MLDVDDEAIKDAMLMKNKHQWKGKILRCAMEDFDQDCWYSCIVMRYSIGYLSDTKAIKFLQTAKKTLRPTRKSLARGSTQESYIVIQDQILPEDEDEYPCNNECIRH